MNDQIRLKKRTALWNLIRDSGLGRLWAPFMVDVALDLAGEASTIEAVVQHPRFLEECRRRADNYSFYSDFEWTPSMVLSGMHGKVPLISGFVLKLFGMARKRLASLHDLPVDRYEEYLAVMRFHVLKGIEEFVVGRMDKRRIHTFGLEAYLINFAYQRGARALRQLEDCQHLASISLDQPVNGPAGDDGGDTVANCLEYFSSNLVSCRPFEVQDITCERIETLCDLAVKQTLKKETEKTVFFLSMVKWPAEQIAKLLCMTATNVRAHRREACALVVRELRQLICRELGFDSVESAKEALGCLMGDRPLNPATPASVKMRFKAEFDALLNREE